MIIQLELLYIISHQQDTLQGIPESTGLLIIKDLMTKDHKNGEHPVHLIEDFMIRIERVHPVNIVELVMTNAEQDITQVTEALEEDIAVQKAQAAALLMVTLQATAQVTVSVQMIVSTSPPTATLHLKDVVLNRLVDIIERGNHHQINIFIKTFIVNPMDKRNSHLTGSTIAITEDDPNISRGDCHCLMKLSTLMNKDSTSTKCLGIKI